MSDILAQHLKSLISKEWKCESCDGNKKKSIEVFLLEDNSIVECIICEDCGQEDHNAELRVCIDFNYSEKEQDNNHDERLKLVTEISDAMKLWLENSEGTTTDLEEAIRDVFYD